MLVGAKTSSSCTLSPLPEFNSTSGERIEVDEVSRGGEESEATLEVTMCERIEVDEVSGGGEESEATLEVIMGDVVENSCAIDVVVAAVLPRQNLRLKSFGK